MLSLVERGLRNPTLELTLRIADGIGADLPALLAKARRTVTRQEAGKTVGRNNRPSSQKQPKKATAA